MPTRESSSFACGRTIMPIERNHSQLKSRRQEVISLLRAARKSDSRALMRQYELELKHIDSTIADIRRHGGERKPLYTPWDRFEPKTVRRRLAEFYA